ncbi:MAG: (2Fe-2S)-binding protein [Spirochaetaceae bacterium]|nr:MAG: (2Fe-2S)-binding protein [Spirochaetaceae bacterium]
MGSILENGRIKKHPILGSSPRRPKCTITVDSLQIEALQGEPILASLLAAGIHITRTTERFSAPRGLYCGIGVCTDCLVSVDGFPNVRSCVTPVKAGMVIETRGGKGSAGL